MSYRYLRVWIQLELFRNMSKMLRGAHGAQGKRSHRTGE